MRRDGKGLPMIRSLADIGRKMSARTLSETKGIATEVYTAFDAGFFRLRNVKNTEEMRVSWIIMPPPNVVWPEA